MIWKPLPVPFREAREAGQGVQTGVREQQRGDPHHEIGPDVVQGLEWTEMVRIEEGQEDGQGQSAGDRDRDDERRRKHPGETPSQEGPAGQACAAQDGAEPGLVIAENRIEYPAGQEEGHHVQGVRERDDPPGRVHRHAGHVGLDGDDVDQADGEEQEQDEGAPDERELVAELEGRHLEKDRESSIRMGCPGRRGGRPGHGSPSWPVVAAADRA
ncbi:MAG: hypothetical protein VKP72_13310 [bacterium]|nr:hypothetical protein [bacterium]